MAHFIEEAKLIRSKMGRQHKFDYVGMPQGIMPILQKKRNNSLNYFLHKMVGVAGFEPAAHWSQTSCATKLRYTPIFV